MNETRDVIVVGVDGSPGSARALEWAMQEAERRGSGHGASVRVRGDRAGEDTHGAGAGQGRPGSELRQAAAGK